MTKRLEHDVEINRIDSTLWGYLEYPGKLGLLDYISFNGKQQHINYTYDNLNRVSNVSEMRLDTYYFTSYAYDYASRVSSVTYPTGFQMKKEYTTTGHLSSLTDSNNQPLWRTLRKNAAGQIETYMTGDSLITKRSYEPETGRLLEILTLNGNDTIQENSYEYDKIANLAARTDHVHDMREDFLYDRLNRLTGIVEDGDTTACFDYDAYGRMLRKYMHSALVFDSAAYNAGNRPHAIAQAQTPLDLPLHRMRYTHFDKLAFLMQDTLTVDYGYGFEHQRLHMTEASIYGDTLVEKEYVDNCEYIDNGLYTTTLTYLTGPIGVFGVQEQREDYRPDRYFIHPDHLGSWTLVTDSYANIRQDVMYDAWGTAYCFTATGMEPATSLLFDRGFTGHEHLLYFGLINMNGRMYDPFTSGFLSVDNYVQSPDYTQSFNRYAYCLNNPLKYTDPDGEFWHLIIGAAIGGIANLASGLLSGQIDTFGEGLAYFGIGAAAGALSSGVGAGVSSLIGGGTFGAGFLGTTAAKTAVTSFASGLVIGASSGLTGGFVTGAGNSWMQGANFGQGLLDGAKAGGKGFIWGAIGGGLAGGIDAAVHGRDFWSGDVVIKCNRKYPIGQDYQQQPGSGDCAIKSGKAIHDFDNDISISSSQIRKDLGLPCSGGVSDVDYWNAFGDQYGYDISRASTLTDDVVSPTTTHAVGSFNDGAHVALSNSQSGTDITHTVLIRQTETRFHTTWGTGAHVEMSYKYWVQNPTTGCMDPTPYSSVGKVVNMFIIRKR